MVSERYMTAEKEKGDLLKFYIVNQELHTRPELHTRSAQYVVIVLFPSLRPKPAHWHLCPQMPSHSPHEGLTLTFCLRFTLSGNCANDLKWSATRSKRENVKQLIMCDRH